MVRSRTAGAAEALQQGEKGVGHFVFSLFKWLLVGNGSSLVYALVGTAVLFLWTTDTSAAVGVLVGFSLYSLIYIPVQIISLIVELYRTGGTMTRALADIGMSLTPGVPLIVLATMTVMRGFSPTWLTYVIGGEMVLAVIADILAVLLFMRATQRTFESPGTAHPA